MAAATRRGRVNVVRGEVVPRAIQSCFPRITRAPTDSGFCRRIVSPSRPSRSGFVRQLRRDRDSSIASARAWRARPRTAGTRCRKRGGIRTRLATGSRPPAKLTRRFHWARRVPARVALHVAQFPRGGPAGGGVPLGSERFGRGPVCPGSCLDRSASPARVPEATCFWRALLQIAATRESRTQNRGDSRDGRRSGLLHLPAYFNSRILMFRYQQSSL